MPINPPPPPAVAEPDGEARDLISELPNCILASILSLLPIKDSVRTAILSARWRHLWKEVPLRLDDSSLRRRDGFPYSCNYPAYPVLWDWSRRAVSSIFKFHHGPVESLSLSRFTENIYFPNIYSFHQDRFFPAVDEILESAVRRGLRELALKFGLNAGFYCLRPSLLHCESLVSLSLTSCQFIDPLPPSVFPNLKELRLYRVKVSSDSFKTLLSSCRFLETLHLFYTGSSVLSVSSPGLRKLFWCCPDTEKLIVEHAPNLESLMLHENTATYFSFKVKYAPKLQLLGFLPMKFEVLQLGENYFRRKRQRPLHMNEMSLIIDVKAIPHKVKKLSSVKTLAIKMESPYNLEEILPSLFRCFPHLENLDILNHEDGNGFGNRFWDEQDSFDFLDHLKTVTLKGFYGLQNEVEFLRFIVVHGMVLKKINLLCSRCMSKKDIEITRLQICMDKKASSDLELFFYSGNCSDHFTLWNELY